MFWNKNKYVDSYSEVTVNGKTIRVKGNNITVVNDKIIVDGKVLNESMDFKNITVIVEGDCNKLDTCGDVQINGNCGSVDCSGSCHIEGNVTIPTVNGPITVDPAGTITVPNQDGTTTVTGTVEDNMGNTGTCSLDIKKDSTNPSITVKNNTDEVYEYGINL